MLVNKQRLFKNLDDYVVQKITSLSKQKEELIKKRFKESNRSAKNFENKYKSAISNLFNPEKLRNRQKKKEEKPYFEYSSTEPSQRVKRVAKAKIDPIYTESDLSTKVEWYKTVVTEQPKAYLTYDTELEEAFSRKLEDSLQKNKKFMITEVEGSRKVKKNFRF